MRTVALRVVALALLLLLALVAVLSVRTLDRLPDVTLYLVRADERSFTLESVYRRVRVEPRGSDPSSAERDADHEVVPIVRAAIEALVAGPTAAEAARGLSSAVPSATRVLSVGVERGLVTIDLSEEFVAGGGTASMLARLHQVRYSAVRPRAVEEVALRVEGEPLRVLGGEGIMVEERWRPDGAALPRW